LIHLEKIPKARGEIKVPGDKSISHRGIMLGALGDGVTEISGFLNGADCLSTISCFRSMGIKIEQAGTCVKVFGKGVYGLEKPGDILYTGNSGTTTRLLTGLLAGQRFDSVITGDASIAKRPMGRVVKPLSLMGAAIEGEYCPLKVHGVKLHGIDYKMEVASAQVKTALILAGLYAEGKTVIHESVRSRNHTELMLKAMGADIRVNGYDIEINPVKKLLPQKFEVPGDISSAAFFIVLGLILPGSEILIKNVGINDTRTGIIDVLTEMGADLKLVNKRVSAGEEVCDIVAKSSELNGTVIGGDVIPRLIDELPVIAVAAAFAKGKTLIKDAQELKVKETNRIFAVVNEFSKCGIDIAETEDGMIINGGRTVKGAEFKSYGDHRMAMSLAILAQMAEGDCKIDEIDCVSVSYPEFFEDLYRLGK
jgi:3-phosphoshikimate 1-carboxyvinyltransferase